MPAIQPLRGRRSRGAERRQHRRFNMTSTLPPLAIVASGHRSQTLTKCELVDLAFGGMRFRSTESIHVGEQRSFLAVLPDPFNDLVFLKARIEWSSRLGSAVQTYGASFFESSKAYFASYGDDGDLEAAYPGPREVV